MIAGSVSERLIVITGKLSALEKKRAFQTLFLEPDERTTPREKDAVSMLVAWTYTSDLFHGLNEKQRRAVVLDAELEDFEEDDTLINVGEISVRIHVVLHGQASVYTMRGQVPGMEVPEEIEEVKTKEQADVDLKAKFQGMQRRASIAVRSDPSGAAPVLMDDAGQAVAAPAVDVSVRRRSIAIAMSSAPILEATGDGSKTNMPAAPAATAGEFDAPVRLEFSEGDALGVQATFHNADDVAVAQSGFCKSSHTVTALTAVKCMVIKNQEHIQMMHVAYQANIKDKVKLLKTVSNYATHPEESIEAMAKHCRRKYYKPGDRIIIEDDEASEVFYIASGQCRVVKDLRNPGERALNVLGRGACLGDWGVVNKQKRIASCVAVGETQLLVIGAFNFEATATQSLLEQLSENAAEGTANDEAEAEHGAVRKGAVGCFTIVEEDEDKEEEEAPPVPSFQLITRRDKRNAGAKLRAGQII